MNKKISFPIVIIIIVVCLVLVGGIAVLIAVSGVTLRKDMGVCSIENKEMCDRSCIADEDCWSSCSLGICISGRRNSKVIDPYEGKLSPPCGMFLCKCVSGQCQQVYNQCVLDKVKNKEECCVKKFYCDPINKITYWDNDKKDCACKEKNMESVSSWKVYQNKKVGYELKFPQDWVLEEKTLPDYNDPFLGIFKGIDRVSLKDLNGIANFTIDVFETSGRSFGCSIDNNFKRQLSNKINIGGIFTNVQFSESDISKRICFVYKDKLYSFLYYSDNNENFKTSENIIDSIILNFKLVP